MTFAAGSQKFDNLRSSSRRFAFFQCGGNPKKSGFMVKMMHIMTLKCIRHEGFLLEDALDLPWLLLEGASSSINTAYALSKEHFFTMYVILYSLTKTKIIPSKFMSV